MFFILDNGGRPFKVDISKKNKHITVYKIILNSPGRDNDFDFENPVLQTHYSEVFIGKSSKNSMTTYSGAYGRNCRGNSILFKNVETDSVFTDNNHKYTFIGPTIFTFTTIDEIINFESPMGNNLVNYPYALDKSGNIYLLSEAIILTNLQNRKQLANIYDYYYNLSFIKKTIVVCNHFPTIQELENDTIDTYSMSYHPNGEENYNRLTENNTDWKMYLLNNYKYSRPGKRVTQDFNKVKFTELTKEQYIQLLQDHALKHGLHSFLNKVTIAESPFS
jgi:hypothetical protein